MSSIFFYLHLSSFIFLFSAAKVRQDKQTRNHPFPFGKALLRRRHVILSANAIPGNLLVGTVVRYSTTLADGDYLLQNDPADGIGFYQGAGKTLRAGKAYLHVDDSSGVKSFSLPEDNATSIQGIEISQENNLGEVKDDAVYNLAGQRVLKPGRGLYIMGGKKVVMKWKE